MFVNNQKHAVGLGLTLLSLSFLLLPGWGNHEGEKGEKKTGKPADAKAVDAPRDSANGYLAVADLDKFRTGRSRRDILKDLHWRGDSVEMADCNGRVICSITFDLGPDERPSEKSTIGIHAIFVNNKFVKFIRWLPDTIDVPYQDTTASILRPQKVGDHQWLSRAVESKPANLEDLRKEAKSKSAPPKRTGISVCGILARLMLGQTRPPPATKDDYRKNAALRDQFNAARLDIGMTELQVESILKAKPLEQGKVDAGLYKIYGSNEAFNIDGWLHFSNVLVVFREGKATMVCGAGAGREWRRSLGEVLIDLPKRAATDSSKSRSEKKP